MKCYLASGEGIDFYYVAQEISHVKQHINMYLVI